VSAHVQASLITSPKTRNVILNVRTENGQVHVFGILADLDLEEEILRVTQQVPGVRSVTSEIGQSPIEDMDP
jgi:osmotically-inducible protein OsmY